MVSRQERQADTERRREAMAVLAAAPGKELLRLWEAAELPGEATMLRGPETGLVALRGRMGGGGAPFNFGEATVTRATVKLPSGTVGHAYALGREKEKVRVAAIIDALRLDAAFAPVIEEKILGPLRRTSTEKDARKHAETAATRVDFFTLVRGED